MKNNNRKIYSKFFLHTKHHQQLCCECKSMATNKLLLFIYQLDHFKVPAQELVWSARHSSSHPTWWIDVLTAPCKNCATAAERVRLRHSSASNRDTNAVYRRRWYMAQARSPPLMAGVTWIRIRTIIRIMKSCQCDVWPQVETRERHKLLQKFQPNSSTFLCSIRGV